MLSQKPSYQSILVHAAELYYEAMPCLLRLVFSSQHHSWPKLRAYMQYVGLLSRWAEDKYFLEVLVLLYVPTSKDVHIVVPFAYLLSSYSKFEWAENTQSDER